MSVELSSVAAAALTASFSIAAFPTILSGRTHTLRSNLRTGLRVRGSQIAIAGPHNATGSGDTPSRRRLFVCTPASIADEEPCARRILSTLLTRAYRTPIAASLHVAGAELMKSQGQLSQVVLISDGMETCLGNPAAEAKRRVTP